MTFTDRFKALFSQKYFRSSFWSQMTPYGYTGYSRWSKRDLVEQAYERNPVFYTAANIVAKTIAQMPVIVEYQKNAGQRDTTTVHPMLRAVERSDNFVEMMILYYIVTGEMYAKKEKDATGDRLLGYIPLPSQYTNPIYGDRMTPIQGFEYNEFDTIRLDNSEVFYMHSPNLSQYFHGMSAAIPGAEAIDLHNAGLTWNKNIAQAGGVPSLIAKMPGATKQDRERFVSGWTQNNGGSNNSHKIKTIGEAVDLVNFANKPNDAEWSEALKMAFRMIGMLVGTSSILMNDGDNMTYSNYKEARKALYLDTAIPLAKKFYKELSKDAAPYFRDNPVIKVDVDNIEAIQEDRGLAWDRLTKAMEKGALTPDEVRSEMGYAPLTDEQIAQIQLFMKKPTTNMEAPNAL